jgi:hypothetical protein
MYSKTSCLAASRFRYAWAAQLVNHVYLIDPQDEEVRKLKADALRKLGQLSFGSIGYDDVVRHRCNNRRCINPEHLEIGSRGENLQDERDFSASRLTRISENSTLK